jgi:hypothetical protein
MPARGFFSGGRKPPVRRKLGRASDVFTTKGWQQPMERVQMKHDYAVFAASRLDARERRIFACCVRGYTVGEMAVEFHLSCHKICLIKAAIGKKLANFLGLDIAVVAPHLGCELLEDADDEDVDSA